MAIQFRYFPTKPANLKPIRWQTSFLQLSPVPLYRWLHPAPPLQKDKTPKARNSTGMERSVELGCLRSTGKASDPYFITATATSSRQQKKVNFFIQATL
jgi:hypothetical protein